MSQKIPSDGAQKGFAVGRGLLAAAETLNFSMSEHRSDGLYGSSSRSSYGMAPTLGGGDSKERDSQLPRHSASHLSNTMKLFNSLGLSPTDLDALAQVPEENISVETLPHLIMQLKSRKAEASRRSGGNSRDLPSLSPERSYRGPRGDWEDVRGGRVGGSGGQALGRGQQDDYDYTCAQDGPSRGYDRLEYGESSGGSGSRDRPYSELSRTRDRYGGFGMGASSASDSVFMTRRTGCPSQGKVQDFLGVMPQIFPHVCSLCDFDVHSTMNLSFLGQNACPFQNHFGVVFLWSSLCNSSIPFILGNTDKSGVSVLLPPYSSHCVHLKVLLMMVVNVVGFKRGYNFLDEILTLAKPFGKVVRHLVLDVRPEAFLELSSEEEARAMVDFYSANVTPMVCGKAVKIYHSQTYATIQVSCQSYGRVIYVGQLPSFKTSDASLLKIAEPFGKVRRYFLNRNRYECFIEMERGEDAERMANAYKENPPKFQGKRLTVYVSRKYKQLKHGLVSGIFRLFCSKTDGGAGPAAANGLSDKSSEKEGASSIGAQAEKSSAAPLGPYQPNNPVGVEYMKMGYYCRVCFLFYSNEETAKKVHCSSLSHYEKLKNLLGEAGRQTLIENLRDP
uniref:Matrin 3-like 1.1 n=1 Tax=Scleropages formosus TaxID=113540 RepID=A0A8C9R1T9_SCLFO